MSTPVASLVEKLGLQKYKSKYKKLGATAEGGFDPDNGKTAKKLQSKFLVLQKVLSRKMFHKLFSHLAYAVA